MSSMVVARALWWPAYNSETNSSPELPATKEHTVHDAEHTLRRGIQGPRQDSGTGSGREGQKRDLGRSRWGSGATGGCAAIRGESISAGREWAATGCEQKGWKWNEEKLYT